MVRRHFRIESRNNSRKSLLRIRAIRPVFQANVQIAGTGGAIGHDRIDTGDLPRFFRHRVHNLHGLVHGRAFGHGDAGHEHALIFIGHEGGRHKLVEKPHESANQNEEHGSIFQMMNHPAHFAGVFVADGVKGAIEFPKETAEDAFLRRHIIGLQNHSAQRRRQGQSHDGRDGYRHGDGDGELLVQHAHGAAKESHRDEDGRQHGGGGNDRPLHLIHGNRGRLFRRQAVSLHVFFYVFDDYDSIIDNHTDGQYEREKRQRIDSEIQDHEGGKGTDDGNRHGQDRDQGGAPLLQEHKDHKDDQEQRLDESHLYFFDGCIDEGRIIYDDFVIQIRREIFLRFRQDFLHRRDAFERVCIIGELHAEADTGLAIDFRIAIRALRPGHHFRHILQANELAIGAGLHDDVAKLLCRRETAFHLRAVLLLLILWRRRCADSTGRGGLVLFLDGAGHIGHRKAALCQFIRIQPHAHGVSGAEGIHIAHAAHAFQLIDQINVGVVFQKGGVIGAVWRIQIHHQRHVTGRFPDRKPAGLHLTRETILRKVRRVLHIDGVCISVRIQIKNDGQAVAAAIGRSGGHIIHALDAVQLIFQDLRHGLIHRLRVGAGIAGGEIDGWRRNLRILRDGEADQGNRAQEHNDQRHHDGKDRPPYKEF